MHKLIRNVLGYWRLISKNYAVFASYFKIRWLNSFDSYFIISRTAWILEYKLLWYRILCLCLPAITYSVSFWLNWRWISCLCTFILSSPNSSLLLHVGKYWPHGGHYLLPYLSEFWLLSSKFPWPPALHIWLPLYLSYSALIPIINIIRHFTSLLKTFTILGR